MTDHSPAPEDGAPNGHLDDETLSACLDAELEAEEASVAARHLAACSSCRARLESISRAAETVGLPVEPLAPATLQRQLERALDLSRVRPLEGSARLARRPPAVARWAAALLIATSAGAAVWHFHADLSGGSSATSASTTIVGPTHRTAASGGSEVPGTPILQLRLLEEPPYRGCTPPSATAHGPSPAATTLYDASASQSSGAATCSRVGAQIVRIDHATNARVVGASRQRLASLILFVPASSASTARSLLAQHAGRTFAIVSRGEVIGYLSTTQPMGHTVTIVRVPTGIARAIASELPAR